MLLLFNFPLEYGIRKVQEIDMGLDINGTHQLLAYVDDLNLIGDDIRTIEKCRGVIKCLEGCSTSKHKEN